MASDVDDLTNYYASLPSIFESNPSSSTTETLLNLSTNNSIDSEKSSSSSSYQPMFGSFLFADSEPLTRAAFVPSVNSSMDIERTEDQLRKSPSPPIASIENLSDQDDDDDDEDDFDGIPIRHPPIINKILQNGDIDRNAQINDSDDDEELFLNGFTDDQHHEPIIGSTALFSDIPDIDDLNEHDEFDDDQMQLDRMDMLDQSDSIRSSSPDSVLSSSHLRDDDDDDENDDDDVTQWNDEFLLGKTTVQVDRSTGPLVSLHMSHPHDQVDFIDSSRSASRCSNASSHLSLGYTDQARIFTNDDGLVTSSDSEIDDDDHVNRIEINDEDDDDEEELSLQIHLDPPHSRSLSNSPNSTRSPSPIPPDQSPIMAIDDEIHDDKPLPIAPIAQVDDDDLDDQTIVSTDNSPPLLLGQFPWKNLIELNPAEKRIELVHDIIHMRQIYEEHENDDEFLAIMHNPSIFEDVLRDNNDDQVSRSFSFISHRRERIKTTLTLVLSPSIKVKVCLDSFLSSVHSS